MKKFVLPSVAACGLLLLSACSSDTKTAPSDSAAAPAAAAATVPAGPVTGKTAYWEMYTKARAEFAKDIVPISLDAKAIPGIANGDGTAAMWTAEFVSETQKERRTFTYAVAAHAPDIYKGVVIGKPLPWSGSRDIAPFSMSSVPVDSDAAFKAASEDAGKWLKDHPLKNPTISLKELTRYQGVPTWIVFWGDDKLGFRSFISAMDGKPMAHK
jgi:hypothetical protein